LHIIIEPIIVNTLQNHKTIKIIAYELKPIINKHNCTHKNNKVAKFLFLSYPKKKKKKGSPWKGTTSRYLQEVEKPQ
jgi:hypothetical protein